MNPFELRLKGLPIRRPSAGYRDRVLAQRPPLAEGGRSRLLRRPQLRLLLPAAAAMLAVLGLGAAVYWYSGDAGPGTQRASSSANGPSARPAPGPQAAGRPAAPAKTPATLVVETDLAGPVFSEGLAAVAHHRFGYIDHAGEWVIPPKFSLATRFEHGIARVYDTQQGPFHFINHRGERVAAETADRIVKERTRPAIRPAEGKAGRSGSYPGKTQYGFVDRGGKFVIRPQYDQAFDFSEGLARVCVGSRWGFIDRAGAFVITPQYASAGDFSEGLAAAQPSKEQVQAAGIKPDLFGSIPCGYIDRTGKFVIPPRFSQAVRFSEGLAYVRIAGGDFDGFIDHTGTLVIDVAKLRSETVVDMEKLREEIRKHTLKPN